MSSVDHRRGLVAAGAPGTIETAVFALSLLTGPLLSRSLGAEGRGSLAAVIVPLQLLGWMLLLGVPYASAMLSRSESRRRLIDGAWTLAGVVLVPVGLVAFVLAPHMLSGQPNLTVTWFRVGLVGMVIGLPAAVALQIRLIRTGATPAFSLAKSLHYLGYSAAVGGLAVTDRLSLSSGLAAWVGSFVLAPAFVIAWLRAVPQALAPLAMVREQVLGGRANAFAGWATAWLGRFDQVFLAILSTPASLGYYAVAATAAQVSLPFCKGLGDVVFPRVAKEGEQAETSPIVVAAFAISLALGVATAVVAPVGIPVVFGSEFSESVSLLLLLLPGQVLFNTAWVISAVMFGSGRANVAAQGLVVAAVLNLLFIIPAIKIAGPEGAALLTTICQGVYLGIVLRQRGRYAGADTSTKLAPGAVVS